MRKVNAFFWIVVFVFLLYGPTAWGQKEPGKEPSKLQVTGGHVEKFDFEQKGIEAWKKGRWPLESGGGEGRA